MPTQPTLINGRYTLPDGTSYPRVSDILAVLARPSLISWQLEVGADEAKRISREARTLGTRVHEACERINREFRRLPYLDAPDPELEAYVEAYCRWVSSNVAEVLACERVVYHDAHAYAGTLDLLACMKDGRVMVADIKTSNSTDATYRLQLTAYLEALRHLGEQVDGRLLIQMPSRRPGVLNVIEYDNEERDARVWRACIRAWRFLEETRDEWKRGR
jgi:predicted RecB family nuclease